MPGPQYGVPGDARPRMSTCRPQRRERREWTRKDSLTVLVLVASIIGCLGVLGWIAKKEGTPDGEVRRYLTYLAQGDAEGALSMVDPGVPNDQRLFLTNEVMASASSRLIIESVEAEDNGGKRVDSSTVTVSRTSSPSSARRATESCRPGRCETACSSRCPCRALACLSSVSVASSRTLIPPHPRNGTSCFSPAFTRPRQKALERT